MNAPFEGFCFEEKISMQSSKQINRKNFNSRVKAVWGHCRPVTWLNDKTKNSGWLSDIDNIGSSKLNVWRWAKRGLSVSTDECQGSERFR